MNAAVDVTLVTFEGAPSGSADDWLLRQCLEDLGARVRFAVWDDPGVDWAASPRTVIRSTWDYFHKIETWRTWLGSVLAATALYNSADLIRWNMEKSYLIDLERSGVAIVPTAVVERRDPIELAGLCADRGWSDVVVKPAIAASAYGARRFTGRDLEIAGNAHLRTLVSRGDALVQPYQRSVEKERERSLVFIGGEFGHAFSKDAFDPGAAAGRSGERCHRPSEKELDVAVRAIEAAGATLTYARVDLVPGPEGPMLMELELIEPHLAFRRNPATARALARILLRDVSSRKPQGVSGALPHIRAAAPPGRIARSGRGSSKG
jgi:hypothetical protein